MVYPDYADEAELLVQQASKLEQAKKVAAFYQNDDYGKGGLEGVRRGVKGLSGIDIATELVLGLGLGRGLGPGRRGGRLSRASAPARHGGKEFKERV